jgi:osmotically-inducible protein OsmY
MKRETGLTLLYGIGIGAALMYLLDPDRGGRRRALLRDKAVRASNKTQCFVGKMSRDLSNRAQGLVAETKNLFRREDVSDDVLLERIKAEVGRHAVHHRAVEMTVDQGRVTLRGPALASEVDELIAAVESVRGVTEVSNQLEVHEQAGSISSLQGEVAQAAAS